MVPQVTLQVPRGPGSDTIVYRRTVSSAGRDSSAGVRTVEVRRLDGALPLLEVVQRFPGGGGIIVDTALAELRTLRAVAHSSHQPARTMRFTFEGNYANGTVATRDSVAAVHQGLGGPVFDSNIIEMVVAALPLARGFSAELPFYIYERGGRVPMTVRVKERSTTAFGLGPRDAWVVAVGVPGAPATVWVDAKTRAVLRVRYELSARGLSFTDERATALRHSGS